MFELYIYKFTHFMGILLWILVAPILMDFHFSQTAYNSVVWLDLYSERSWDIFVESRLMRAFMILISIK